VEYYRNKDKPEGCYCNPEYAAMVQSIDQNVGRLIDKLRELNLEQNTAVFFFSDNGGFTGEDNEVQVCSNEPLRSGKGSLYKGGIRVPLIVKWPGHTETGSTLDTPVISMDLYPTILEIAGASPEPSVGRQLDGVSLLQLLKNRSYGLGRDFLCWHFPHYYPPVSTTPISVLRYGEWKLIRFFQDNRLELYNLADDPGEKNDLSAGMPDMAAELNRKLASWLVDTGAQLASPNPDYNGKE